MSSVAQLFQPIKIGALNLSHRIVLAPLTRFRANKSHVPVLPLVKQYYAQRATMPGTLLITEATFIAPKAGGFNHIPGIWSQEQISAWKEVTDAVHAKGSYIFLQMWALGRTAEPAVLSAEGIPYTAPSPIPPSNRPDPLPRELTISEIQDFVQLYVQAAKNAVHKAGFDGVEIHGASGYLPDQFLHDSSNTRTDQYGGNIKARSRFGLELVKAVTDEVGEERTGYRLSPYSTFRDMGLADTRAQYTDFVSSLKAAHPNLAYLHLIEPRVSGPFTRPAEEVAPYESNDFLRKIWSPRPLISAGGFTREQAIDLASNNKNALVAFGRHFIANPDLPLRLKKDIALNSYDRSTFYMMGDQEGCERGYIDYPFADVKE